MYGMIKIFVFMIFDSLRYKAIVFNLEFHPVHNFWVISRPEVGLILNIAFLKVRAIHIEPLFDSSKCEKLGSSCQLYLKESY